MRYGFRYGGDLTVYTNALGSLPTQSFLLFKYLIPTLFLSFYFLFFHFIFFPPLPSPVLSFCFVDFSFFFFFLSFFFLFFPQSFFPLLFYLPPFHLVYPTNHLKCPATFEHERTLLLLCWHSENLSRALLKNSPSVPKQTHALIISTH